MKFWRSDFTKLLLGMTKWQKCKDFNNGYRGMVTMENCATGWYMTAMEEEVSIEVTNAS